MMQDAWKGDLDANGHITKPNRMCQAARVTRVTPAVMATIAIGQCGGVLDEGDRGSDNGVLSNKNNNK